MGIYTKLEKLINEKTLRFPNLQEWLMFRSTHFTV